MCYFTARKLKTIPGLEMEALWCISDRFGTEIELKKAFDKQINETSKEQYLSKLQQTDIRDRFRDWNSWFQHGIIKFTMDEELSEIAHFLDSNDHTPESPVDANLSKIVYQFFKQ